MRCLVFFRKKKCYPVCVKFSLFKLLWNSPYVLQQEFTVNIKYLHWELLSLWFPSDLLMLTSSKLMMCLISSGEQERDVDIDFGQLCECLYSDMCFCVCCVCPHTKCSLALLFFCCTAESCAARLLLTTLDWFPRQPGCLHMESNQRPHMRAFVSILTIARIERERERDVSPQSNSYPYSTSLVYLTYES